MSANVYNMTNHNNYLPIPERPEGFLPEGFVYFRKVNRLTHVKLRELHIPPKPEETATISKNISVS